MRRAQRAAYDASGRVCRPAANPCENDAVCAGQDPDCLPNPPKPQGTPCGGPRNGDCDVADTCDGSSRTCPDRLAPPSQPCRTAADECDVTEFCTGTSPVCPAESFAPAGTVCRPGQRPCEADALCSGADPTCPLNPRKPAGTVCRAAAGACDVADTCNGTSFDCPDTLKPAGTVCVSSTGPARRSTAPRVAISVISADAIAPICRPTRSVGRTRGKPMAPPARAASSPAHVRHYSATSNPIYFCFSPKTCQTPRS